ncbi:MAG: hypothetical protein IJ128_03215 [Firmicutes bacterium]|nr:hypothetical protein [Bacillota bacterium]
MIKNRIIICITIIVALIAISAAFAYGKAKADAASGKTQKSYFDTLNDYDWSKACPAAGCRN